MLKEKLTGEQIARLPLCRTTQMFKFDPITTEDREFDLVIKIASKWIKNNDNPNTGFTVTPYAVTITWIDCCVNSLVINFEEGFILLHADCATTDTAVMIDNLCGMLAGEVPFHKYEEGIGK